MSAAIFGAIMETGQASCVGRIGREGCYGLDSRKRETAAFVNVACVTFSEHWRDILRCHPVQWLTLSPPMAESLRLDSQFMALEEAVGLLARNLI